MGAHGSARRILILPVVSVLSAWTASSRLAQAADTFVRVVLPPAALVDQPVTITCRLEDSWGRPAAGEGRFTLTVSGGASFGATATTGTVISGGGTSAVVLDTAGGVAALPVRGSAAEEVRFNVVDSEGAGIRVRYGDTVFDFEDDDGGFVAEHDPGGRQTWQWGVPESGPGFAASGRKVWATNLVKLVESGVSCSLFSPTIVLPDDSRPGLTFRSWSERFCSGWASVAVFPEGADPSPLLQFDQGWCVTPVDAYSEVSVSLAAFAGRRIRLQFFVHTDIEVEGWYIDDVTIRGASLPSIRLLEPDEDPDCDGLTNELELVAGTAPFRRDTDGDLLADSVETGTGVFRHPSDTGTDPLRGDSDSGGLPDGVELQLGLNPLNAVDDAILRLLVWELDPAALEYDRAKQAIRAVFPWVRLREIDHVEPAGLAAALGATDVLLIPPQDRLMDRGRAFVTGQTYGATLRDFVARGGIVVATHIEGYILRGAGLMDVQLVADGSGGAPASLSEQRADLSVVDPDHFLVSGVKLPTAPFVSAFPGEGQTSFWTIGDADTRVVLAGADCEGVVVAAREFGDGAAILVGLGYQGFNRMMARVLANAVSRSYRMVDRDGDGIADATEAGAGLRPNDPSDASGDLDGDGVTNLDEFLGGTRIDASDTDGDGLSDSQERDGGETDPRLVDTDSDGRPDPTDPVPESMVRVAVDARPVALAGSTARVVCTLLDPSGAQLARSRVRFGLETTGSATFRAPASVGTVISGGGTSAVLVETSGGSLEIEVHDAASEQIRILVTDPASVGLDAWTVEARSDFDVDEGGFAQRDPGEWEWGMPTVGPVSGRTRRVWGTSLFNDPPQEPLSRLESPEIDVPADVPVDLLFRHYFHSCNQGIGRVRISVEGGIWTDVPGVPGNSGLRGNLFECDATEGEFRDVRVDLSPWGGRRIRLRFQLEKGYHAFEEPGWFLESCAVVQGEPSGAIRFLSGGLDEDGDGLSNAEELAEGTDPLSSDTDRDGLSDAVETGTGEMSGPEDTGTDPTNPDTDGDGLPDGREVARGLDPHEDSADRILRVLVWAPTADRLEFDAPGNAVDAMRASFPDFSVSRSATSDPAALAEAIRGQHLMLMADLRHGQALALGETLAAVLQAFTRGGGVVVALGETAGDLLRGAGLLNARAAQTAATDLYVAAPSHPMAAGVTSPVQLTGGNFVYNWIVDEPDAVTVLADAQSNSPVLLFRELGRGAVVLTSLLYSDHDDNSSRLLANAFAFIDADADGIPDLFEDRYGLDPNDPADAEGDPDSDGLSNLAEAEAGTDPTRPDTDSDGLSDGDELALGADPRNPDTDGDGLTDGVDPYPTGLIHVVIEVPYAAVAGAPASIRCRLAKPGGEAITGLHSPVRFTLLASGSAVFPEQSDLGRVLDGIGTSTARVECDPTGIVVLDVVDPNLEEVRLGVQDSEGVGLILEERSVVHDFETSGGGFREPGVGGIWNWRVPKSGPRAAHSGERVWASGFDGDAINRETRLISPTFTLPADSRPKLTFWHWYYDRCEQNLCGWVQVSVDSGTYADLDTVPGNAGCRFVCNATHGTYEHVEADLSRYAGHRVSFQFDMEVRLGMDPPQWYLDDVGVVGLGPPAFTVVEPDGDLDGDGVANAIEVARGASPLSPDTDDDGLSDSVETGTGVFRSLRDTGTDPGMADTDSGGVPDSRELDRGMDPFDPRDDRTIRILCWTPWGLSPDLEEGIEAFLEGFEISSTFTEDPAVLASELDGMDVLLIAVVTHPWTEGESHGQALGGALRDFVGHGGLVVGLSDPSGDMLRGAGLLHAVSIGGNRGTMEPVPLRSAKPGHPVLSGIPPTFPGEYVTNLWRVTDPDREILVTRAWDDAPAVVARRFGSGAVLLLGFTYHERSEDILRILVNGFRAGWLAMDTDQDGMDNSYELQHGLDPRSAADGEGDPDGDGLDNAAEYAAGTDPTRVDTDGDGWSDFTEVSESHTDPLTTDTDGDGVSDSEDAFPKGVWVALELPPRATVLESFRVTCRVQDFSGSPVVSVPVPFVLSVSGSANFADTALEGRLLSGGGTSSILAESDQGVLVVEASDGVEETIAFDVAETQGNGARIRLRDFIQSFEENVGFFTHGGRNDSWEWGVPTSGPGRAATGDRVFATNLSGSYLSDSSCWLASPPFDLAADTSPWLIVTHWFEANCERSDLGRVQVSADGGAFVSLPGATGAFSDFFRCTATEGAYREIAVDMSRYVGQRIVVRFLLESLSSTEGPGWYVDDFMITDVMPNRFGVGRGASLPSLMILPARPEFHRGDANDDTRLDISDAIFVLRYLFLGTSSPECLDATDGDDDGTINLTDAIYLLRFLFAGGPPPPYPGTPAVDCGPDPGPEGSAGHLGCEAYRSCVVW